MTRSRWALLLAAVLLPVAIAGAWLFPRRPSILLITIDTMRPDRIASYGHPTNRTPAMDRLAAEGMLFERAYCDMPWTTGSMASVMTGSYSNFHGLRDPASKIDPDVTTIAQILQSRGMQTGAIIGSFPLDSIYGLDKGFETYDDEFDTPMFADPDKPSKPTEGELPDKREDQRAFIDQKQHNDWYRTDEGVTDAAIRWLEQKRDGRPFFLWVHYFGPHEKLDATRNHVAQEPDIIRNYDGDVEATDRAVGRLIEHLRSGGLLDRTMVVLHADHGQNLGEENYVGHTLRLDEVAVRVPMILRYPSRIAAGTIRRDIAKNVDLVPTLLELTGQPGGKTVGRSLLPNRNDPTGMRVPLEQQTAYFETYLPLYFFWPQTTPELGTILGPMVSRGVRTPDWKMLVNEFRGECEWGEAPSRDGVGTWHVSDSQTLTKERCAEIGATFLFRSDAAGTHGISPVDAPPPEVVETLNVAMHAHDEMGGVGEKFELNAEQTEKLRSLGYLR